MTCPAHGPRDAVRLTRVGNAEVVRRSHELFDANRVDDWAELFTEDVEVPALALIGRESVYRGREALRRWHAEVAASGTQIRAFADELVEVDDTRVVVAGRVVIDEGDGRSYGSVAGWVYTLRDGRVCRVEIHSHPGAAFRTAGVEPEAAGEPAT